VSAAETIRRDPDRLLAALLSTLEARGKVSRVTARGFDALCPCHDDTRPSLHVEQGTHGIVMKCRACGATPEQVLDRIGAADPYGDGELRVGGLFYESTRHLDPVDVALAKPKPVQIAKPKPAERAKPKAAKATPSRFGSSIPRDDRERLLAAADVLARLEAERGIDTTTVQVAGLGLSIDGRVLLPTYARDGEPSPRSWVPFADQRTEDRPKMMGAKGASPDLYPRPESPAFVDGSDVLLVEGEPDALCAITNGLAAIGCPGAEKWVEGDATRFARFGSVTILPDADEPGRRWARTVEAELREAGVRVLVRDFGDSVPKGFDLTDYALRCNADGLALAEAIERLPLIVAGSRASDLFGEVPPAEVASIGGGLWYRGSVHVLFGLGGAGKTYLFLTSAREEIRNGGRVLFVDYETGVRTVKRRLHALGFTPDDLRSFVHLDVKSGNARPLEGDTAMLHAYLDTFRPTLVGVDSWSSVHGAGNFGDVKDDEPVERVIAQVFRPLTRTDAAVVILDHVPKGEQASKGYPYGSQRKRTGVDVTLEAKSAGRGRTKLLCWKDAVGDLSNDGTPVAEYHYADEPAQLVAITPDEGKAGSVGAGWRPTGYMERVSVQLERAGDGGLTASELKATVGGKSEQVLAARRLLVTEGYAEETRHGGDGERFTSQRYVSAKPYREADDTKHVAT
jgi:hypothetical protein